MGAWGIGNFENDDAADWVYDLEKAEGTELLSKSLQEAVKDGYLEAPECTLALAAAEVVAALTGRPAPNLPDEVKAWVSAHDQSLHQDLVAMAHAAVSRIKVDSELLELWQDTDDLDNWIGITDELLSRLGAA